MTNSTKEERRERLKLAAGADRESNRRDKEADSTPWPSERKAHRKDAAALRAFASLCRSTAPLSKVRKAFWRMDTELRDGMQR